MKALAMALSLVPTAALADFDCMILQRCGGGACEAYRGGPMIVRERGDLWQVEIDGAIYEGNSTTTLAAGGEVSIVLPPQQGMSGLVSIYPSGEVSFTVHGYGDSAFAVTGSGNCAGEGG